MRYFLIDKGTVVAAEVEPGGSFREIDQAKGTRVFAAQGKSHKIDPAALVPWLLTSEHKKVAHTESRRAARNALLTQSDWTQTPDAFGGDKKRQSAWRAYRQELRDLDMAGSYWPGQPA